MPFVLLFASLAQSSDSERKLKQGAKEASTEWDRERGREGGQGREGGTTGKPKKRVRGILEFSSFIVQYMIEKRKQWLERLRCQRTGREGTYLTNRTTSKGPNDYCRHPHLVKSKKNLIRYSHTQPRNLDWPLQVRHDNPHSKSATTTHWSSSTRVGVDLEQKKKEKKEPPLRLLSKEEATTNSNWNEKGQAKYLNGPERAENSYWSWG